MQRTNVTSFILYVGLFTCSALAQQPNDGENSFYLSAVNQRFLGEPDTISCTSGRGIQVADLDMDGKPEILVTEYRDGGRILAFEVVGNNTLEYIWGSKRLNPGVSGGNSTPRSVSVGDFDNNGMLEIHFQVGYFSTDSLQAAQRGLYIYEFTGTDNDFGSEPAMHIPFEDIDPVYSSLNIGRNENGLTCQDVDGDGKNELLFVTYSSGNLDAGNMYILEVESGTFQGGDASIRVEYKYSAMAEVLSGGFDGYVPVSTAVGDVDNDGLQEIVVLGWTNIASGAGVGFLEVSGVDNYSPGSIVSIGGTSIFSVKGDVKVVDVSGEKAVIIGGGYEGQSTRGIYVMDNLLNDQFISQSDLHLISEDVIQFGVMAIGDQDHGTGSDGFDIYVGSVNEVIDIEYNGSGALSNPASYTNHGRLGQINLNEIYDGNMDFADRLFNSIYTYPGMDLDNDGNLDIVAGYKGLCSVGGDTLGGEQFTANTYGIYVFEWGDSTQSIPITLTTDVADADAGWRVILPDDYELDQNYPNPFNPSTTISFSLPLDKTVSLKIYNSMGQEVKTLLVDELLPAGKHNVTWDATNNEGRQVSSGVYIYKLFFGNFSKSRTMMLVR